MDNGTKAQLRESEQLGRVRGGESLKEERDRRKSSLLVGQQTLMAIKHLQKKIPESYIATALTFEPPWLPEAVNENIELFTRYELRNNNNKKKQHDILET
ncbi:hypothetical protein PoB_004817200 [Plakobranchus ocellatus]|uniref:Uncharacterized protein n=1 Tax=Plakobranchus ocellatus TaxID=259542 RepID=A0AAV4BQL9_9GAST|nr:hypothetical protein PoB_004817200 [Plakobranchus ocellatus]